MLLGRAFFWRRCDFYPALPWTTAWVATKPPSRRHSRNNGQPSIGAHPPNRRRNRLLIGAAGISFRARRHVCPERAATAARPHARIVRTASHAPYRTFLTNAERTPIAPRDNTPITDRRKRVLQIQIDHVCRSRFAPRRLRLRNFSRLSNHARPYARTSPRLLPSRIGQLLSITLGTGRHIHEHTLTCARTGEIPSRT